MTTVHTLELFQKPMDASGICEERRLIVYHIKQKYTDIFFHTLICIVASCVSFHKMQIN